MLWDAVALARGCKRTLRDDCAGANDCGGATAAFMTRLLTPSRREAFLCRLLCAAVAFFLPLRNVVVIRWSMVRAERGPPHHRAKAWSKSSPGAHSGKVWRNHPAEIRGESGPHVLGLGRRWLELDHLGPTL